MGVFKEVNAQRQRNTPGRQFTGASSHDPEVRRNPSLALDYIVAPPRMAHYIDWSTRVYSVYLKHVAPEDIYPYSIDEVFIDATSYLQTYHLSAREFARKIILDILQTTGITAAAGIGTNLYLAKVAMDIGAKHVPADEYGVRIAELDEMGYRRSFWTHRPLTDFWRVGKGYAAKLEAHGLYTMGDIARCSIGKSTDYHNEELLYKLFGVNAELLIDHAWGWEPCTIADIKAYKPENKSIVSGQILQYPYPFEKARLVIQEMADALALEFGGEVPNVVKVALDCENFGADGITVHPRPDERHIRRSDVYDLRPLLRTEFNIEGYPAPEFIDLVLKVKPHQVTLVPDSPTQLTSNSGWDTKNNLEFLTEVLDTFNNAGIRTSVFVSTDVEMIEYAAKAGADRVELYTEPYATAGP